MNAIEVILMLILLLAVSLSLLIINKMNVGMVDAISNVSTEPKAKEVASIFTDSIKPQTDILLIFAFVGIILALIVSEMLVQYHPIFLGLSIVSLVLLLIFAPTLSNLYGSVASQVVDGDEYQNITNIWQYLPLIMLIVSIFIVIVQLIK